MEWIRLHLRLFIAILVVGVISIGSFLYLSGYTPIVNIFKAAGNFTYDNIIVRSSVSDKLLTCNAGPPYSGPLTFTADVWNKTGVNMYLNVGTHHEDGASCSNAGGEHIPGLITGTPDKTLFKPGEKGTISFTLHLNAATCGRVQIDVAFFDSPTPGGATDPSRILVFGRVYQYASSCGGGGTPTPTPPPTDVVLAGVCSGGATPQVSLSWNAVSGYENYRVRRSPAGIADWTTLATISGVTYVDTTATPNSAYDYEIVAIDTDNVFPNKQSNIYNITASAANCGATAAMVCTPATQTVAIGQTASFATSGSTVKVFSWGAPGGNPASQAGPDANFATTYSTAGNKVVTVTAGTQTATCNVVVTAAQGLVCAASPQSAQINQNVTFTATGASAPYSWTGSLGSNNSPGTTSSFVTTYPTIGTKSVTVTSGSLTATCSTVITATTTNPTISIEKLVRDVSSGQSTYVDSVNASPNDVVEFSVRVSASGSTVNNVVLTDVLPSRATYVAGSTTVDGVVVANGVTAAGISLGNMAAGTSKLIKFRALIAGPSSFSQGSNSLVDNATANSSNAGSVTDSATVIVTITPSGGLSMTIQKFGRNSSRGELNEQSSVTAYPGNTLEFSIHVRNTSSSTLTNVMVRDVLPNYLSYVANSTNVDGLGVADGIISSSGINIGSLSPNQLAIVKFFVTVVGASALPIGQTNLINVAYASATGIAEIRADLPITIIVGGVIPPGQVPTGPADTLLLSLFVSGFVTFMYMLYTRTTFFKKHEIEGVIEEQSKDKDKFNFEK